MDEGKERIRADSAKGKTVNCRSCGAEFDASSPTCPYCGTMYLPAAETAYMHKLEGIRGDLEGLGALGKQETRAHFGRLSKKVLIFAAILVLAVIAVVVILLRREHAEAARDQAEFLWQRKGFVQMDEYYDAGKYDELVSYYNRASEEGHQVWQYRHRDFCEYYNMILMARNTLEAQKAGDGSLLFLFMDEVSLYRLEAMNGLSDEERTQLQALRQPLLEDFNERFDLTEEELNGFRQMLERNGFVSIESCEQVFKERGWEK